MLRKRTKIILIIAVLILYFLILNERDKRLFEGYEEYKENQYINSFEYWLENEGRWYNEQVHARKHNSIR